LYERGPHGFGIRDDLGTTSGWMDRWVDWMRAHGWLDTPRVANLEWARGVEGQKADLGNVPLSLRSDGTTRPALRKQDCTL
jgi:hypothetical protein